MILMRLLCGLQNVDGVFNPENSVNCRKQRRSKNTGEDWLYATQNEGSGDCQMLLYCMLLFCAVDETIIAMFWGSKHMQRKNVPMQNSQQVAVHGERPHAEWQYTTVSRP